MEHEKTNSPQKLQALAAEACDLWQEHLAAYAADPKAKAEMMRLLEPSRQLFAEWTRLMQHGLYGANSFGKNGTPGSAGSSSTGAHGGGKFRPDAAGAAGTATAGSSSRDGALDVGRLAARVEELEAKLARLEPGTTKETRGSQRPPRPKSKP